METSATVYCEQCGALIEAASKFCAQCGNKQLHETSANESQKQSESPRETEKDRTSIPLAIAGICILALVAGTLLFSVLQRSTSPFSSGYQQAVFKPLPADMPPFGKFKYLGWESVSCGSMRTYTYKTREGREDEIYFAQIFLDCNVKAKHPFFIERSTKLSHEFWVDDQMNGKRYEYYDGKEGLLKNHPNLRNLFFFL